MLGVFGPSLGNASAPYGILCAAMAALTAGASDRTNFAVNRAGVCRPDVHHVLLMTAIPYEWTAPRTCRKTDR